MAQIRVAVSMTVLPDPHIPAVDPINSLAYSYITLLEGLEILPVLIPNNLTDVERYVEEMSIQGVLLTGGNDISPEVYGQILEVSGSFSQERDCSEFALLHYAKRNSLPVLGVCRGMQLINLYFGGGLKRFSKNLTTLGHVRTRHKVLVVDSTFARILGTTSLEVNSFHNYFVDSTTLGSEIRILAVSEPDGVIEGISHPSLPIVGIQWHPERPGSSQINDRMLIRALFYGI